MDQVQYERQTAQESAGSDATSTPYTEGARDQEQSPLQMAANPTAEYFCWDFEINSRTGSGKAPSEKVFYDAFEAMCIMVFSVEALGTAWYFHLRGHEGMQPRGNVMSISKSHYKNPLNSLTETIAHLKTAPKKRTLLEAHPKLIKLYTVFAPTGSTTAQLSAQKLGLLLYSRLYPTHPSFRPQQPPPPSPRPSPRVAFPATNPGL